MGLNIMQVVKEINEKTKAFAGMKVPVKLVIDTKTKDFTISVGTPPASALILKEIGVAKGSGNNREVVAGNITMEQIKKVARMKETSLYGNSLKDNAKTIVGTCYTMGIKVEGKDPHEVQREISRGKYDDVLKE